MVVRPLIPALIMLGVALAGCASEPDGEGDAAGDEDVLVEDAGLATPVWYVGMSWTWDYGASQEQLVVTSINSDGTYSVDTMDDRSAFSDAVFGGPIVGKYRVADLGHEIGSGTFSNWMEWPLQDDKTWTVDWYGTNYQVSAVDLGNDRFHMTSTLDGAMANEFWYNPTMGFYEGYQWYDAEGNPTSGMEATREPDFTGEVVRADVTELYSGSGTGPRQDNQGFDLSGASDDAEVYALLHLSCQTGTVTLSVGNGNTGQGWVAQPCPVEGGAYYGPVPGDLNSGQWGILVDMLSPDVEWSGMAWLANYERIQVTPDPPTA